MKDAPIIILSIVGLFVAMFGLQAAGMVNYSFFGKWQEQVRTEIQRESFAYTDGMMKNLQSMAVEWASADTPEAKDMILAGVRQQYGSIDTTQYPDHLKSFLREAGIY